MSNSVARTAALSVCTEDLSLSKPDPGQWAVCALAALAVHIAVIVAILPRSDAASADAGSPVIMVEFAPQLTAPAETENEAEPGPPQPEPATEEQRQHEKQPDPMPEQPVERQAALIPEIASPVEKPKIEEQQQEQEAQPERPPPSALPKPAAIAPQAAAPAPGEVDTATSKRIATWQLALVAHLQGFKRYPREARPAQGTVNVAFRIDREGRLIEAHVAKSSGSTVLDADALALVKRAAPLPKPPVEAADAQLSQVAPVRYLIGGG